MKKRFSSLVIVIILLLSIFYCAFAEQEIINFSSYSDEELLLIRAQLNKEFIDRKIAKKAIVPPGTYIIGVDLPEGRYVVTGEDATIYVYESTEIIRENQIDFIYLEGKMSESLSVSNGQAIIISHDSIEFEVYSGIVFE